MLPSATPETSRGDIEPMPPGVLCWPGGGVVPRLGFLLAAAIVTRLRACLLVVVCCRRSTLLVLRQGSGWISIGCRLGACGGSCRGHMVSRLG